MYIFILFLFQDDIHHLTLLGENLAVTVVDNSTIAGFVHVVKTECMEKMYLMQKRIAEYCKAEYTLPYTPRYVFSSFYNERTLMISVVVEGKGFCPDSLNIEANLCSSHLFLGLASKYRNFFVCYRHGEVCLAKWENNWYRVIMIDSYGDKKPLMQFIDFGNQNLVKIENMRPMPLEFKYPNYAVLVEIGGRSLFIETPIPRCHLIDL